MRIGALADESDIGLQIAITGNLHPREMKVVFVEPNIFAAGCNGVRLFIGIVLKIAAAEQHADIALRVKHANLGGCILRGCADSGGKEKEQEAK